MNSENTEHLISMANQIASNMAHGCTDEEAVTKISTHMRLFWAPVMRENLCAELDGLDSRLNDLAFSALKELKSAD